MVFTLLLALLTCSENATDTSLPDPPPEQEEEICTQDEFCDAFMDCFAFMGLDLCESYYEDGMGVCADASEEELVDFHLCMCGCWTSGEDRSCMGMGSCSDWCTSTFCSVL